MEVVSMLLERGADIEAKSTVCSICNHMQPQQQGCCLLVVRTTVLHRVARAGRRQRPLAAGSGCSHTVDSPAKKTCDIGSLSRSTVVR